MRISDWSSDVCSSDLRLLLTAKNTGEEAAVQNITVTATDAGAGTDISQVQGLIAYDSAAPGTNFTFNAAKNATLLINGISVTSQSNTIEDAIEGVTLTLTKKSAVGERSEEHTSELQSLMRN